MRIRLSDVDRERFGCEEWLSLDPGRVTNREMVTLQSAFGYDDISQFTDAFNAQFVREQSEGEESPKLLRIEHNYNAWDTLVWLCLRQAGVLTARARAAMATELGEIEYEVIRLRVEGDEPDDEGDEGKDESFTPDRTSPT